MNKRSIFVILAVLFLLPGLAVAGFTDNGNGTATDNTTNLMWQQCSHGLSGVGCATGTAVLATWENAIIGCEGLAVGGFTDWRLPNVKELTSLADMTKSGPALDAAYFPNTIALNYWTSTSYAPDTAAAWVVHFLDGSLGTGSKALTIYVRCVRGQ